MSDATWFLGQAGKTCSACGEGRLVASRVTHDLGPLLGMRQVKVDNLPALVCARCGEVTLTGPVINGVAMLLAATIISTPGMGGPEVRYLRKLLGDTQEQFGRRLGVDRVTVNRWENMEEDDLPRVTSQVIRLHAFVRLRGRSRIVEAVGPDLAEPPARARPRPKRQNYKLRGEQLREAA